MKLILMFLMALKFSLNFQFLWGWNRIPLLGPQYLYWLSIPLRMKHLGNLYCTISIINFQFLWGWNMKSPCKEPRSISELSIPLRMKHSIPFSPILLSITLSIPLRMKPSYSLSVTSTLILLLSIPLRMKLRRRSRSVDCGWNFQFLWGWNGWGFCYHRRW